jgi:alkanesulfonate monooxygenase SsuD/methylene tetrahydromethanopterin reductase-like flavin-dependent oxidoreductase (luciferase family)
MDFGVFSLMGFREAGKATAQVIDEAVEQTRLGDELGFGMAWFAEHHFSNYCINPSPLMMVARCAGVTKKIKLATGVLILPLYSPARLLSEIALTDAMCNGRLVLGIGSGYQPYEFDRFDADLAESKERAREFIDIVENALTSDFFEHTGKYYSFSKTHVSARLVNGLPQIWIGGDSPETQALAARNGYVLIFSGRADGPDALRQTRARAEAVFKAEGVDPKTVPLAMLRSICVTHDPAQARRFAENVIYQNRLAQALRRRQEMMQGTMLVDRPFPQEPTVEHILNTLPIGDPNLVAERIVAEIRALEPVHISAYFQLGDTPQATALRSMELFAGEVVPLIERELGPIANLGIKLAPKRSAPVRAKREMQMTS